MKKSTKAKRDTGTNQKPTASDIAERIAELLGVDPDSVKSIQFTQASAPHVKQFRVPKWTVTVQFADLHL